MYAMLGNIKFDLLTSPISTDDKRAYTYAEHAVIEGKPRLQYTGDDLESIDITFRFHKDFCDPASQQEKIIAAANAHKALPLVMGDGTYIGYFVILEVSCGPQAAMKDGSLIYTELSVKLKEWVDENTAKRKEAQKKANAPARGITVRDVLKLKKQVQIAVTNVKLMTLPQLQASLKQKAFNKIKSTTIVRLP